MNTYIVTEKTTGREVYRYQSDVPVEWQGMEFATHDHTVYVEPASQPPVPPQQVWDRVTFLRRFTAAERTAIRTARVNSPTLDDFMYLLESAVNVHSDDADVMAGLTMLEGAGLLAAGRAQVILNG